MASRAALRASDADRDRAAELLHKAATEGRLLTEELEQRLESALGARTYGQLEALLDDLPGARLIEPPRLRRPRSPATLIGSTVLALLGVCLATVLVLAIIVQLAFGLLAAWWIWLLAGWLLFGRRRLSAGLHGQRYCAWHAPRRVHRSYWA